MIRFENVSKVYADGHLALDKFTLHIEEGELLVLIGPSGSGKTTSMKMINRLIKPTSGKIMIRGKDIVAYDPVQLRRQIGYVIQHVGLLPHMTIVENIMLVPKLLGWPKQQSLERAKELLNMVHLPPNTYMDRYPTELSGGQQQRVGVVRALAANPPVILMDEPFSALDPISREQLQEEFINIQAKLKKTIVFVTHDMHEAIRIADRICILNQGRIVQLDTPERILRCPADDFVKTFMGRYGARRPDMMPNLTEVMVRPITDRPQRGLAEGLNRMRHYNVDSLIITDENNRMLGVARIWDIHNFFHEENRVLADVMLKDYPIVHEHQSLNDAIKAIRNRNFSVVPVLNADEQVIGVITRASLADVITNHFSGVTLLRTGS